MIAILIIQSAHISERVEKHQADFIVCLYILTTHTLSPKECRGISDIPPRHPLLTKMTFEYNPELFDENQSSNT
jgi:hypothetical protein